MSIKVNPARFPEKDSLFMLDGPEGQLEIQSTFESVEKGIGIICHPHPLHGGSMSNKVVYIIAQAMRESGLNTLRFNFRGVDKSHGTFGEVEGEVEDLLSVVNWVVKVLPSTPIFLVGFSFGAFIAAKGAEFCYAQNFNLKQLISVAPAVHLYPYESLQDITCPWLVLHGTEDELIPEELVKKWVHEIQEKPNHAVTYMRILKASHFFHGKLLDLKNKLSENLSF